MQNPSTTLCLTEAKKKGWKLAWLQIYFLNLKTWPFFTDLKLPGKFSNPLAKARKVLFWGAKTLKATLMVNSLTKMKAMTSAISSGIFQLRKSHFDNTKSLRQKSKLQRKINFFPFVNISILWILSFFQFCSFFAVYQFCHYFFNFVHFFSLFTFHFWFFFFLNCLYAQFCSILPVFF